MRTSDDTDLLRTITRWLADYCLTTHIDPRLFNPAEAAQVALRAVRQIPGNAWTFTATFDGDTHRLECDFCSEPVCTVEAGDTLEGWLSKVREHRCKTQAGAFTYKPIHDEPSVARPNGSTFDRVPSRVQARDEPCADRANCDVHRATTAPSLSPEADQ